MSTGGGAWEVDEDAEDSFLVFEPQVNKQNIPRASTAPDTDELARFRQEWKNEVLLKTRSGEPSNPLATTPGKDKGTLPTSPNVIQPATSSTTLIPTSSVVVSAPGIQTLSRSHLPKKTQKALDLYSEAVEFESQGQQDHALRLYQDAFRLESNIDRFYDRHLLVLQQESDPAAAPTTRSKQAEAVVPPSRRLEVSAADGASVPIRDIIKPFPTNVVFHPLNEEDGNPPLELIPDEILVAILHMLDHGSVEKFALVCRKARLITLESSIWQDFVSMTYKPPQINDPGELELVVQKNSLDYRKVYVEHPRVRTDGVYIALNQYIRSGESDSHWVNVNHLITYYRYLRFFPNGHVLSLLVQGEEYAPKQIIPILKPGLRRKDLSIGKWELKGTQVQLVDLADASGHFRPPPGFTHSPSSLLHESLSFAREEIPILRYAFTMTLHLKSKPVLGKWNRLDILNYESVNLENGDAVPVSLKKERPFWFSRVRSYV